ncbi:unnamed protein product, partial [marine sediment metagenome]
MWDPTPTAELHFTYMQPNDMDPLYVAIQRSYDFDVWTDIETDVEVIAGTEETAILDMASIGAFALTDKCWYRFIFYSDNDMNANVIYNAHIVLKQSDVGGIIKCVPEYLMINSTQTGTGDTDFLTSYEPNEWNAEGGYAHHVHCMDCGEYGTSIILHDEGDTKLDGSDIFGHEAGVDHQSFGIDHLAQFVPDGSFELFDGNSHEGLAKSYPADGGKCIGALINMLKDPTPGDVNFTLEGSDGSNQPDGNPVASATLTDSDFSTTQSFHTLMFDSG